jgi:hypothetical protein
LIFSLLTGKRDYENTNHFVADPVSRVSGVVQITSDGWTAYVPKSRAHLPGRLNLAVRQKIYNKNESESILHGIGPNYRHSLQTAKEVLNRTPLRRTQ